MFPYKFVIVTVVLDIYIPYLKVFQPIIDQGGRFALKRNRNLKVEILLKVALNTITISPRNGTVLESW